MFPDFRPEKTSPHPIEERQKLSTSYALHPLIGEMGRKAKYIPNCADNCASAFINAMLKFGPIDIPVEDTYYGFDQLLYTGISINSVPLNKRDIFKKACDWASSTPVNINIDVPSAHENYSEETELAQMHRFAGSLTDTLLACHRKSKTKPAEKHGLRDFRMSFGNGIRTLEALSNHYHTSADFYLNEAQDLESSGGEGLFIDYNDVMHQFNQLFEMIPFLPITLTVTVPDNASPNFVNRMLLSNYGLLGNMLQTEIDERKAIAIVIKSSSDRLKIAEEYPSHPLISGLTDPRLN